jgi:UPF0042 nucleotide-binding protein
MSAPPPSAEAASGLRRVVLVSGLSGAGRTSILRCLEDLGFETIDNPPLALLPDLVAQGSRPLAIGVDSRTSGFRAEAVLAVLAVLRADPRLASELVFALADEEVLLRRYTETRRRHPLAPASPVREGIAAERALLAPLRAAADWLIDTSRLSLPALRRLIEERYGPIAPTAPHELAVSLISFSYASGLPGEADLVFDARFLRNPHYVAELAPLTGLDPRVAAHIEADPHLSPYLAQIAAMLLWLLPRFLEEGKKYVTIAIGCTGGRHRSVHLVERIAALLREKGWRVTTIHRELARLGLAPASTDSRALEASSSSSGPGSIQAKEA